MAPTVGELEPPSGGLPSSPRTATARQEFDAFYRAEVRSLIAFVFTVSGAISRETAADAAQEAMIEVWQRWANIKNPRAYVRTVASRKWFQRHLSHEVLDDFSSNGAEVLLVTSMPDDANLVAAAADFRASLERLTISQRQVLAWSFDGYKPAEISRILDLDPATTRSHLSQARKTVREGIKVRGDLK